METQQQPQQQPGKIHAAIVAVMREIGAIEKTQKNEQQNFFFRGVGDAMAACQPLFAKYNMYVRPVSVRIDDTKPNLDREGKPRGTHSRQIIVYRATSAEDGSYVDSEATGEAIDFADKCAGKVMSVSFKFLIFQMFCIPDHNPENDPDGQSPGDDQQSGKNGKASTGKSEPTKDAKQEASDAAKRQKEAMDALVKLLDTKGVTGGKAVLAWFTQQTKRDIKKLSELSFEEYQTAKAVAEKLPAKSAQGKA